jgi:hypothetical protein
VIQSDDAGIDDQPPSFARDDDDDFDSPDDDAPEPDPDFDESVFGASEPDPPDPDAPDFAVSAGVAVSGVFDSGAPSFDSRLADRAAERRSSLAQPEPLNTTAGAAMPLRIVPSAPQLGQKFGPLSWIPCRISVR